MERAATRSRLPARLEVVAGEPPLILDAAHNPAGMRAVVESLPELAAGRPVVALLAALDQKPADGLTAPLAGACETVVCTEIPPAALAGVGRPGARAHPAAALAAAAERAGGKRHRGARPGARAASAPAPSPPSAAGWCSSPGPSTSCGAIRG